MIDKDPACETPSLSDPEKHGVWEMYMAGWSAADIEAETGVLSNNIRKWAHREKWNDQRDRIQKLHDKAHPAASLPMVKAVAKNPKGEMREQYLKNTGVVAIKTSQHWAEMEPEELLACAQQVVALDKMNRGTLEIDAEDNSRGNALINLTFLANADQPGMVIELEPSKVKEITDAE